MNREKKFRVWDKRLKVMSIPFTLFDEFPFGAFNLETGKEEIIRMAN